jgi:phage head maturation protease
VKVRSVANAAKKSMAGVERRSAAAAAVPILAAGENRSKGPVTVGGVALEWGALSEDLGFRELLHRDAFRGQERDGFDDVTIDVAHESVLLLGSVRAGTARIDVTRDELRYAVDVPRSFHTFPSSLSAAISGAPASRSVR